MYDFKIVELPSCYSNFKQDKWKLRVITHNIKGGPSHWLCLWWSYGEYVALCSPKTKGHHAAQAALVLSQVPWTVRGAHGPGTLLYIRSFQSPCCIFFCETDPMGLDLNHVVFCSCCELVRLALFSELRLTSPPPFIRNLPSLLSNGCISPKTKCQVPWMARGIYGLGPSCTAWPSVIMQCVVTCDCASFPLGGRSLIYLALRVGVTK